MSEFVCECGKEAKSNAGLSSHQRRCEQSANFVPVEEKVGTLEEVVGTLSEEEVAPVEATPAVMRELSPIADICDALYREFKDGHAKAVCLAMKSSTLPAMAVLKHIKSHPDVAKSGNDAGLVQQYIDKLS